MYYVVHNSYDSEPDKLCSYFLRFKTLFCLGEFIVYRTIMEFGLLKFPHTYPSCWTFWVDWNIRRSTLI